jgi:hypothetical protein
MKCRVIASILVKCLLKHDCKLHFIANAFCLIVWVVKRFAILLSMNCVGTM